MTLRSEIRQSLSVSRKDAIQLLKDCPSSKDLKSLLNNLRQLSHVGKILPADSRRYVMSRSSCRTRRHEINTKYTVWALGHWPLEMKPASNIPRWLTPQVEDTNA